MHFKHLCLYSFLLSYNVACSQNTFESSQSAVVSASAENSDDATASTDLILKVDDQIEDFEIKKGEDIDIFWDATSYASCEVSIEGETHFQDLTGSFVYSDVEENTDVTLQCDGDSKTISVSIEKEELKESGMNLSFDGYTTRKEDGSKLEDPVTMHFVIDVTSSMDEVLDVIVSQIGDFVKKLKSNDIDISLSLTTFRDTVEGSSSFEGDIDSFRRALRSYKASGGEDIPEASLRALEDAALHTEDNEDRDDAIRTLILITDSWGHNALNVDYDCDITPTTDTLKGLFSAHPGQWKFFYSSRDDSDIGLDEDFIGLLDPNLKNCQTGWSSPVQQYESINTALSPQTPADEHKLPWPFTKESLLDQLYNNISEAVADTKLSCMVSEVEVRNNNEIIKTWSPDVADIWKNRTDNVEINLEEGTETENLSLFVKKCCLPTKGAKDGNFASCKEDAKFKETKIEKTSA